MSKYGEPFLVAGDFGHDGMAAIVTSDGQLVFGYSSDEGALDFNDPRIHRVILAVNACAHLSDEALQECASGKRKVFTLDNLDVDIGNYPENNPLPRKERTMKKKQKPKSGKGGKC